MCSSVCYAATPRTPKWMRFLSPRLRPHARLVLLHKRAGAEGRTLDPRIKKTHPPWLIILVSLLPNAQSTASNLSSAYSYLRACACVRVVHPSNSYQLHCNTWCILINEIEFIRFGFPFNWIGARSERRSSHSMAASLATTLDLIKTICTEWIKSKYFARTQIKYWLEFLFITSESAVGERWWEGRTTRFFATPNIRLDTLSAQPAQFFRLFPPQTKIFCIESLNVAGSESDTLKYNAIMSLACSCKCVSVAAVICSVFVLSAHCNRLISARRALHTQTKYIARMLTAKSSLSLFSVCLRFRLVLVGLVVSRVRFFLVQATRNQSEWLPSHARIFRSPHLSAGVLRPIAFILFYGSNFGRW